MTAFRVALFVSALVGCRIDGYYVLPESSPHVLTVQVGGHGTGSVSSDPNGLACSAGTCSGEFSEGTVVRLSAAAATGSFLGWTEVCRGQGTCTITMDRDQVVGALFGTPGEALWVSQLGSREDDSGRGLAVDSDGNLIAAGVFRQTLITGANLTSDGDDDIYVVKLASSTGSVIWAKRFGGTLRDNVFGVAVDGSNNIYIGGTFQGTLDFGGGSLTAMGPIADFVLKLDTNGSFGWARQIDGSGFDNGGGAIATNGDTVVIADNYTGSFNVDTTTLMGGDMFALKVSASTGATIWVKSLGGTSSTSHAYGVALDSNGNVILSGKFSGTVNFGGGQLSASNVDGFLLKLADRDGAHLLSKQFGSAGYADSAAIAVDSENQIFVTGSFLGSADFGCTNKLTSSRTDLPDVFLVKYTQAGSCTWAKGFGGADGFPTVLAIAVNNLGEVAVAGEFCGSISFGGETLSSASACLTMDAFAARFAGDGMHLSSVRAGGMLYDSGLGIAQSSDGRLFVTGKFGGFAEFGGEALNDVGGYDAFIVGFPPL